MTPQQIDLVQESFEKLLPIREATAQLLFLRLMERDPSLQNLFRCCDLKQQGGRVMDALGIAVSGLDDLDNLLPGLRDLAGRHVAYGVKTSHYQTFGEALLWTLEIALGNDFNLAVRQAWVAAYEVMADTMVEAADRHSAKSQATRRRGRLRATLTVPQDMTLPVPAQGYGS